MKKFAMCVCVSLLFLASCEAKDDTGVPAADAGASADVAPAAATDAGDAGKTTKAADAGADAAVAAKKD